jgi:hypothetical protein
MDNDNDQPKKRRRLPAPVYRQEVLANSIFLSELFDEDNKKVQPKFYVRNGIILTFIK